MIFTTRYLNDVKESIFYGLPADEEKSKAVCEKKWLMDLDHSIKAECSAVEMFHIQQTPEKLIGIGKILHEEDNDYDFESDPEVLSEEGYEYLDSDICDFLQEKKISEDCAGKIFKYLVQEGVESYANYENCYIKENKGSDGVIYRAIGIKHLPKGMSSCYYEWASFLTSFSICDRGETEIILCLHSGTDYDSEKWGYIETLSDSLSKKAQKTISVYTFHHDPDIYPIAREICNRENTNNLECLWKKIKI